MRGGGIEGGKRGRPEASAARKALLLLFLVLASPLVAKAEWAGDGLALLPARSHYQPGDQLTLSWPAFPGDVEEYEILLSFPASQGLRSRITENRHPSEQGFCWTVPNLPCAGARLVVRAGRPGLGEVTWAVSQPFSIRSAWTEPVPRIRFRRGDWWLDRPADTARPGHLARSPRADSAPPPSAPANAECHLSDLSPFSEGEGVSNEPSTSSAHLALVRGKSLPSRAPLKRVLRI